uniref:Uncharacterized protein n=1 Tax=Rhizophora mucronata TaxID=61149 RepID=A0A2P2M9E1_RHIMU
MDRTPIILFILKNKKINSFHIPISGHRSLC